MAWISYNIKRLFAYTHKSKDIYLYRSLAKIKNDINKLSLKKVEMYGQTSRHSDHHQHRVDVKDVGKGTCFMDLLETSDIVRHMNLEASAMKIYRYLVKNNTCLFKIIEDNRRFYG